MGSKIGKVTFDMSELEKMGQNVDELIRDMPDIMLALVAQETEVAIGEIKSRTPVREGKLQEAWHSQPVTNRGKQYTGGISNNLAYAAPVEYGHRIVSTKSKATAINDGKLTIQQGKTIGYKKGQFMMFEGMAFYRAHLMLPNIEQFMDNTIKEYMEKK